VNEAKAQADAAVKGLPDSEAEKAGLQNRVDGINPVNLPTVNDVNNDGKLDARQLSEANFYVGLAEGVRGKADSKLKEIDARPSKAVNPKDVQVLAAFNKALHDAQIATDALPDSEPQKSILKARLDRIPRLTIPEVNDKNSNGIIDSQEPVPVVTSIKAVDNVIVNDMDKNRESYEVLKARQLYNDNGKTGERSSGGLTNDKTPEFTITLDKPLVAKQQLVIVRAKQFFRDQYIEETPITTATLKAGSTTEYTFTDSLPDNKGINYRYVAYVSENNGKRVSATETFILNLDTRATAWALKEGNSTGGSKTLVASNLEEGMKYVLTPKEDNSLSLKSGTVGMNGQGELVIPNGVVSPVLYFTDKAGNVGKTRLNIVNGIWLDVTTEKGIDPNTAHLGDGGQVQDMSDNAIKATEQGDAFLLLKGGEIGPYNINLASGDDLLVVKADILPNANIVMGNGHDRIDLYSSTSPLTRTRRVIYLDNPDGTGAGDDEFYFHFTGKNISGTSGLRQTDVYLGDGDNLIHINDRLGGSAITGGSGRDAVYVYDNMERHGSYHQASIDTKDGNDLVEVRGDILNDSSIKLGSGDDYLMFGGGIGANAIGQRSNKDHITKAIIEGGDGFDTLVLTNKLGDYRPKEEPNAAAVNNNGIQTLDLTDDKVSITGFERISIKGTKDNVLKLSTLDVLENAGSVIFGGEELWRSMIIQGNTGDRVILTDAATVLGAGSTQLDGETYYRYNTGGAMLYVHHEVKVTMEF
ncbi:GA-like domain-containing protein, partial [Rodentibacter heidelbergensis]|uniref:GA-like domain-containing protein n=1 Tax=Rodentibacter heidelbergensis TaxID=1908258 RepID=UPI001ABFD77B